MERRNILSTQIGVIQAMKSRFKAHPCDEGIRYVYAGAGFNAQTYCEFLRMDYPTVHLLGEVSFSISYNCVNDEYILLCETFIDNSRNENLSFELYDKTDYLEFYGETKGEDKTQELPSNWKELLTDEDKEGIAKEWCNEHSDELKDYLSDSDKADIAYDYIDDNAQDCVDSAYDKLGDYEKREFIKDCIDNL